MSKVWSVDIEIAATAYIKAESAQQARKKLEAWIDNDAFLELRGEGISSADLGSPFLPEISLSPAMTMRGIYGCHQMELSFDPDEEFDE